MSDYNDLTSKGFNLSNNNDDDDDDDNEDIDVDDGDELIEATLTHTRPKPQQIVEQNPDVVTLVAGANAEPTPTSVTRGPATETPAALQAFEDYWALGPKRSLAKLAEFYKLRSEKAGVQVGTSRVQTLELWSSTFRWQERLKLRLAEEREETMRQAALKRRHASEDRIKKATVMQSTGLAVIKAAELEKLSVEEARRMLGVALSYLSEGMKTERLELGESSENWLPPKPLEEMTDEELEDYSNKFAKL